MFPSQSVILQYTVLIWYQSHRPNNHVAIIVDNVPFAVNGLLTYYHSESQNQIVPVLTIAKL